jgi:hypothetical protein
MGRETENQWRRREGMRRAIAELSAFLTDPDRKNRTAGRIIDLWDARRARGAEPLFHPTIGGAIRAGRPWLTCYCPGCGVVGEIDLRKLDRHPDASVGSLIPLLSCQRCSPHPPFGKLIGLATRPGALRRRDSRCRCSGSSTRSTVSAACRFRRGAL